MYKISRFKSTYNYIICCFKVNESEFLSYSELYFRWQLQTQKMPFLIFFGEFHLQGKVQGFIYFKAANNSSNVSFTCNCKTISFTLAALYP
jgi:hypothetical protein